MNDLVVLISQLRKKTKDTGNETARKIDIQEHEIPTGVFAMIYNKLTLGHELLNLYYNIWAQTTQTKSLTINSNVENKERVLTIQKMIFIESLSSIEFCSKEYVINNPQKLGEFTNRIYLGKIMERSRDVGIISSAEFLKWEGIIELRNVLVHNNGISEKDATYDYPNCQIAFRKGKMTQGNLKLFLNLIDWSIVAFSSWIIEIDKIKTKL